MGKFSTKRVMNTEDVYCLFVDDNPIGTATWRDGIASATVTYDSEIKYFNNDESFGELIAEVGAYVRKVDAHYNDLSDAEQDEAEYFNIAANYDKLAAAAEAEYHNEVIAPMEHAERMAERGNWFGHDGDIF
jgi:hypothetical protein